MMLPTSSDTTGQPSSAQWPIFVISLNDAHSRRETIKNAFAELGIEFEFFNAIDGRAGLSAVLKAEIDLEKVQQNLGRPVADAELACALSHRTIYEEILKQSLPGAIVLEDDALLSFSFAEFIRQEGYRGADFIQMDYGPARVYWRRRKLWSSRINLVPLAENATCTGAYSISAKAARYVLSNSTPLAGLADWPCDMTPLDPLVTFPRIVTHLPPASDDSFIRAERNALIESRDRAASRWRRFARRDYWRRWWMKRRTRRIS